MKKQKHNEEIHKARTNVMKKRNEEETQRASIIITNKLVRSSTCVSFYQQLGKMTLGFPNTMRSHGS